MMETRLSIRLKTLRKSQSLNPSQVVKRLKQYDYEYSTQSIYKWEEGSTIPPLNILYALSKIYNCGISYLLSEEIEEYKQIGPKEAIVLRLFRTDFLFRNILSMIIKFIDRINK